MLWWLAAKPSLTKIWVALGKDLTSIHLCRKSTCAGTLFVIFALCPQPRRTSSITHLLLFFGHLLIGPTKIRGTDRVDSRSIVQIVAVAIRRCYFRARSDAKCSLDQVGMECARCAAVRRRSWIQKLTAMDRGRMLRHANRRRAGLSA